MSDQEQKMEIFSSEDLINETEEEKDKKEDLEVKKDEINIEEEIKPSKSFNIYNGQLYDESKPIRQINNSKDEINKQRKNEITYKTYDKNIDNRFESPLQRYKRLRNEILQFNNELNNINNNINNENKDSTKNISNKLNNELTNLWKNIDDFKNNPKLSPFFNQNINNNNNNILQTVKSDYLFKKLNEFQSKKTDQQKDNAILKLYHNGSIDAKSYRANLLKKRIEKLETIIGPSANENSKLGNMNLSVQYLHKRLELLSDNNKLDTLSTKAQSLKKNLQEFARKSSNQHQENQITKIKEQRINKMFEMMETWDQTASQLPNIIQRLKQLKTLHQEAANTVTKVNELETEKKVIGELLKNNKSLLEQVNEGLNENAKTMENNISLIEERINDLQSKMQSL